MIRAVVTDIEGTTSAIAFVKETMFPFAEAALDGFLDAHGDDPEVAAILAEIGDNPREKLRGWMAADAKVTALKSLQGLIWAAGFADGRLVGHLWPDVAPCLRAWHAGGLTLAIYSSGSVGAQKLLFGNSLAGDLTPLFRGFFDTRIGAKRDASAYVAIAATLALPQAEILFLSDVVEELDAARAAGLATCQLVRAGDGTHPAGTHPEAPDFPAVAGRFGLPASLG